MKLKSFLNVKDIAASSHLTKRFPSCVHVHGGNLSFAFKIKVSPRLKVQVAPPNATAATKTARKHTGDKHVYQGSIVYTKDKISGMICLYK